MEFVISTSSEPATAAREIEALVRPFTGPWTGVRPTARGFSSDVTVLVDGEKGAFFVKAMWNRPGGRRDSLVREGLVNPFVRAVAPALVWEAESEEWLVLGFEAVEGRSSGFLPGSPDLPAVVAAVARIGEIGLPEVAREWTETRWDRFAVDSQEAALFRGDALLYTDINPSNLMIGDGTTWAVDWAWPTRGAAFIDPACLVIQLVAAGHEPAEAEAWAAHCPAWTRADPCAIDAFARANVRMHEAFAVRRPEADWLKAMAASARKWAAHRGL